MKTEDRKASDSAPKDVEPTVTELNTQEIEQVSGGAGNRKQATVFAGGSNASSLPTGNKVNFFAP